MNDDPFRSTVEAAIVEVRCEGAVHAFDRMNHFFFFSQMVVPVSSCWNVGIGREAGEVKKDEGGIATMNTLGANMEWVMKKINKYYFYRSIAWVFRCPPVQVKNGRTQKPAIRPVNRDNLFAIISLCSARNPRPVASGIDEPPRHHLPCVRCRNSRFLCHVFSGRLILLPGPFQKW